MIAKRIDYCLKCEDFTEHENSQCLQCLEKMDFDSVVVFIDDGE